MDSSSSNHRPAPRQQRGRWFTRQTAWLWVIIGICVVVLAWVLLRPPAAQAVTLFEASNQAGSLLYSKAPHFLASGTVQIDYSVSGCNTQLSLVWIMQSHPLAFGPVWSHQASCNDAGIATVNLDSIVCCPSSEGVYATAVSAGPGARWSLKITQL